MTALDELTSLLSRMPGLGKKSAARIACYLLKCDQDYNEHLAERIRRLKSEVKLCSECGTFTESDPCPICSNPARDRGLICVVEQPQDMLTIEASREFNGLYHVLGGVIAPVDGMGPEKLSFGKLIERIRQGQVREIIVATNPTVEGDTTALYVKRLVGELDEASAPKVTRLASGIPVGGDLEYADRLTLARSLRGRSAIDF
jgi:recombination protein RecR